MKLKTFISMCIVVVAFLLVISYKGFIPGTGGQGTMSCANPMEPSTADLKVKSQDEPKDQGITASIENLVFDENNVLSPSENDMSVLDHLSIEEKYDNTTVLLLAGGVHYAAGVGRPEWRATFEVRVILPSGENIRDRCEIAFYWLDKFTEPTKDDPRWIDAASANRNYPHGLMSIDGHWLDREDPNNPRPPWWVKAHVVNQEFNINFNLIGKCNFREKIERSNRGWNAAQDLNYGVGDRILDLLEVE